MSVARSGRRGRPPEFVEDQTPPGSRQGGAAERAGWLLRRSRLHLRGGRFARQRAFVEALADVGVPADVSRVSRWETTELDVPPSVVAAYEQLLGLPNAALQASVRGLYGALSPKRPAPPLFAVPAGEPAAQAERRAVFLIDLALEGEPTGGQWCELVERIACAGMLIMPGDVADRLVHRLMSELGRSVGAAYITRYEALRRLFSLPRFIPVALAQIDRIAHEPGSGVLVDVVATLTEVPGNGANRLVLKLSRDDDAELQGAALWVAAARVDRGDVTGMQLVHLEQALISLLRSSPAEPVLAAATDLVGCMPAASRQRVLDASSDRRSGSGHRQPDVAAELVSPWAAAEAAGSVARHAVAAIDGPDSEDPLLVRILRDALAHSHRERRHQAGVLLMLSPLRHVVANALLELWPALPPECRFQTAALLTYVCDDSHAAQLDRRIAADGPEELIRWAWIARAHLAVPVNAPGLVEQMASLTPEVMKASLYALGMTASQQLHDIAVADVPQPVRVRIQWWLGAGAAVRV